MRLNKIDQEAILILKIKNTGGFFKKKILHDSEKTQSIFFFRFTSGVNISQKKPETFP